MKLGFVSAILPECSLNEVLEIAGRIGYDCVEVMCWPFGKSERRYAGVTHINADEIDEERINEIADLQQESGVTISALGYYPNPLSPDREECEKATEHICKLIDLAPVLGLENVNSFVGRDWRKSIESNWPVFKETWQPIVDLAEKRKVKIGIENCPMLFTTDEWPGGKNLFTTPAIWSRAFEEFKSDYFGLNFDPSHFIWQHMDYIKAIQDFGDKFYHAHAKDVRLDREKLDRHGIMGYPIDHHTPKLPGLGDVNWGKFFSVLTDVGYEGPVCVEVEDRAFEGDLHNRIKALKLSYNYLRQYIP